MRDGGMAAPFGSNGGMVEVDETYIGHQKGKPKKRAFHHKMKVLTLVDRETRQARSMVVENIRPATIAPILRENMAREARLMTDEAGHYMRVGREFASHDVVQHGQEEYVRGEAHTNTIEGYFSIFKRGMKGIYQHCQEKHLHRYLAEYDFRYNNRVALGVNDQARMDVALKGAAGKRLTYRRTGRRTYRASCATAHPAFSFAFMHTSLDKSMELGRIAGRKAPRGPDAPNPRISDFGGQRHRTTQGSPIRRAAFRVLRWLSGSQ